MWDHETIMMIVQGVGETLYMTVLSTVLGYLFGLPMGVLLAVSDKEGLKPNAVLGGMSFVTKVTVVLCSGGYTGLILGFFGGILYLYRSEPRHLTDSATSQVSTVSKISLNAKTATR